MSRVDAIIRESSLSFHRNSLGSFDSNVKDGLVSKYRIVKIQNRWWLLIHSGDQYIHPAWGYRVHGQRGTSTAKEIIDWLSDMAYNTATSQTIVSG